MAYRKQIRGNDNVASEEFSHNRVNIVMGGAGLLLVGFFIVLMSAAVIWMVVRMATLLEILIASSFILLFLGAGVYGACLLIREISKTHHQIQTDKLQSQLIVAGEIVAYRNGDQWDHLSAQHIAASIPALPMKAESSPPVDHVDKILELHDKGISYRNIEKMLKDSGVTYHQVQKTVNQYRLSSDQQ